MRDTLRKLMLALSIAAVASLTACVTQQSRMVQSNITTFHQLTPTNMQGKKLAILAFPPERQSSLEFASYRQTLTAKFQKKGFVVVDDARNADFLAFVSYGIDDGRQVVSTFSVPEFGQTGGGTNTFSSGTVNTSSGGYANYSGNSYTMPTYGVTGYSAQSVTNILYSRSIAIDIADRPSFDQGTTVKLYEGRVKSQGICASLAGVFDPMTDALFSDFPGVSGTTKTIAVPMKGGC